MNSINLNQWALQGISDSSLIMKSDIDWMNWLLDLPNLTTIISNGDSFRDPRFVTLSSLILNNRMMNRYS